MRVGRWIVVAGLLAAGPAPAQDAPAEPASAEPAPPLDATAVPDEAARLDETLRQLAARAAAPRSVREVIERLDAEEDAVTQAAALTRSRVDAPGAAAEVRDARASWSRTLDRLERDRGEVGSHADRLARNELELAALHSRWTTARAALPPDTPRSVALRAEQAISAIEETRDALARESRAALDATVRLSALQATASTVLADLEQAQRRRLVARDSAPLWSVLADPPSGGDLGAAVRGGLRQRVLDVLAYLRAEPARVVGQALVALVAAVLLLRTRALPPERRPTRDDVSWRALVDVPVSSAIVLALGVGTVLHARAPSAFLDLLVLIAIAPLLRVLRVLLPGTTPVSVYLLLAVYLGNRAVPLLASAEAAFRLALAAAGALALAAAWWALRRHGGVAGSGAPPSARALRWLLQGAAAAFGVAILADVVGLVSLAALIVDGSIEALYVAVMLWATVVLVDGCARLALRVPAAQRLGMIRHHAGEIEDRLGRFLRGAGALAWLAYTLFLFSLLDPLVGALRAVFGAEATIGTITLSLGSVLAFALSGWIALSASRLVRFFLEEDVLPRMDLPKGLPSTVSKITHYTILTLGFFVALAAAGVHLDQFAFLAGALGVGIGFGLQTIVNNFVSGLILLFERPIQEGDVVEVGALTGTVLHIGIRACRVRTFDGAEVIVPNANLIANQVVNWTLTDRVRRFDLPVGAAYGTHPDRVIALLREVARGTPGVLPSPAPTVFFEGFGASSVDFRIRCWAPYDEYVAIRSDMAMRVEAALRGAGIEIPFPQQDLHVRSIDPQVLEALRAGSDRVAPVHDQGLPRDPGGVVAGQEQRGGRDVLGEPDPTEGDAE